MLKVLEYDKGVKQHICLTCPDNINDLLIKSEVDNHPDVEFIIRISEYKLIVK